MGPRRISLVLALLALGLLVASAGVAAATSDAPEGPWTAGTGVAAQDPPASARGGQWSDHQSGDAGHGQGQGTDDNGSGGNGSGDNGSGDSGSGNNGSGGTGSGGTGSGGYGTGTWTDGHSSGGTGSGGDGGSGVGGSSVGTPPTPVEAPPATASGPAPDAVAAAPISTPAEQVFAPAFVPAVGGGGTTEAPVAALVTAPATGNASISLGELPNLGSIGQVASTVGDASPTRTLLSSGAGRPIAIVLALLGVVFLFLSIHRRVDRSDPKLAAANVGPDVVRFR